MCHGKSFRIMKVNSRNGKKLVKYCCSYTFQNGFIKWNQHAIPKTRKYQCHVALSLIEPTIWMHWWVSEQQSNRLHFTNQSGKSSHLNEPVFPVWNNFNVYTSYRYLLSGTLDALKTKCKIYRSTCRAVLCVCLYVFSCVIRWIDLSVSWQWWRSTAAAVAVKSVATATAAAVEVSATAAAG